MKEKWAVWIATGLAFLVTNFEKAPIPLEPPKTPTSVYIGDGFSIARVTLDTFAIAPDLASGADYLASQNCILESARFVPDTAYNRSLLEMIVSNSKECFPELSPFLTNN